MKKGITILIIVILTLLCAVVGLWLYFRMQVSYLGVGDAGSVSIIGGADGPTSIFLIGKLHK